MTAYEKQTIAQSFTAGITGLLKKVEILSIINQCTLGKDYTINFSLLEGDGITGKTLASASIKTTTPLNFGWLSYTFSVPPQINKGDMYTFQISVPPNQHCMLGRGDTLNLSFNSEIGSYDSYAGGCVYINSSKKTIFDLIFRTLVNPTTYSAITKNSCIAFTSPSGKIFSASGVYKDTLISSIACDSIITLNLTVVTDTAVTVNGKTLTSKQDGAIYQWVNCNLGYKPIPLATNKTYTSPGNGTYALIIKNGACTDTTGCKIIGTGGIPVISHAGISVFPNPVSGELYICLDAGIREMQFELHDLLGQVIASGKVNGTAVVSTAGISPGIYLLRLSSGATSTTIKILKE
jgi:hypothetical protein